MLSITKAGGEFGPVAALPAVVNALIDALADYGVDDIDLPATPERIWRRIRDCGGFQVGVRI